MKPTHLYYRVVRLIMGISHITRQELKEYWENFPTMELTDKLRDISVLLTDVICRYATPYDTVIELGSNAGHNLYMLSQKGFRRLAAVDFDQKSIDAMKKYNISIETYVGWLEYVLPTLKEFDIVFTRSVLQHIHPFSEGVFRHIARITRKYLIIWETELTMSPHSFVRDYTKIFKGYGMRQVYARNYGGKVLKVFKKK